MSTANFLRFVYQTYRRDTYLTLFIWSEASLYGSTNRNAVKTAFIEKNNIKNKKRLTEKNNRLPSQ